MTDVQDPMNTTNPVNPANPANPGEGTFHESAGYQQPASSYAPPAYVPTYQSAPMPQPAPAYGQPLVQLTGGQKFGWFAVGFLGNIIGMLLAWLVNVDKAPQAKSDAIKFAVIGFVVAIALDVILVFVMGAAFTAAMIPYIEALSMM